MELRKNFAAIRKNPPLKLSLAFSASTILALLVGA